MNEIYTGIDIGTNSIKIITAEKVNNQFKIIAKEEEKSDGIKRGVIVDVKKVANSVYKCVEKIENILGVSIKKIITCIPTDDCIFNIVSGKIETFDENNITGEDISRLLKEAISDHINDGYELVTAMPIGFKLDDSRMVKDPKGLVSKSLEGRIVITMVPKSNLYNLLNVFQICEIEVVDIAFKTVADYFEVKNQKLDNEVGAIINIGEDTTNVSIYNKGIMIKNTILKVGSYYVDHDFSYIYKIDLNKARELKETFAVCSSRYADQYDEVEVVNEVGQNIFINQLDIAKVTEARITEILKIAKKEIKNLTNRKISYIIILGGLSEITGFQYLAEEILKNRVTVYNSTTVGVRHNKYASVLGVIKYFDDKLKLRDKTCEMFSKEDISQLISISKNNKDNATINTMFEQFLDH